MAGVSVGEFFVKLGSQYDMSGFNKMDSALGSIDRALASFPAKVAGMYWALDTVVTKASQLYINLSNVNKQTGLNEQGMLRIQNIARAANPNISYDEVIGNLSTVQQKLNEITFFGGKGYKPFQLLGLNVYGKDAIDILDQLRERAKAPEFQGKGRGIFSMLTGELGLSPDMINMLQLSDEMYNKYKEMSVLHQKDQETLKKIRYEFNRTNIELSYMGSALVANVSPAIKSLLDIVGIGIKNFSAMGGDIKDLGSDLMGLAKDSNIAKGALIFLGATAAFTVAPQITLIATAIIAVENAYAKLKASGLVKSLGSEISEIIDLTAEFNYGNEEQKEKARQGFKQKQKEWGAFFGMDEDVNDSTPLGRKMPSTLGKLPAEQQKPYTDNMFSSMINTLMSKSNIPSINTTNFTNTFSVYGESAKENADEISNRLARQAQMQNRNLGY